MVTVCCVCNEPRSVEDFKRSKYGRRAVCRTCVLTNSDSGFCSGCAAFYPRSEFYAKKSKADGIQSLCKPCSKTWQKSWYADNPEAKRRGRMRKYGLAEGEYEARLEAQGGVCFVCSRPETAMRNGVLFLLSVDHDHECCPGGNSCGRCVRGLLCMKCNRVLGLMGDSPGLLRALASYAEEFAKTSAI